MSHFVVVSEKLFSWVLPSWSGTPSKWGTLLGKETPLSKETLLG
jgi:hypothetical protein